MGFQVLDSTGRIKIAQSGTWTTIPYNAANFTGDGTIVWTVDAGDLLSFAYRKLDPTTVVLNVQINLSSVSGAGIALKVAVPAAITPLRTIDGSCLIIDNGAVDPGGFFATTAGVASLSFIRHDFGNFAAAVNTTGVFLSVVYQI
jgi:hypothetical protein